MTALPTLPSTSDDCWNRIGVRGDRSCPELSVVGHCHNCPVFAAAGRRFLDAPSPDGYLDEWTERLAAPVVEASSDLRSVLIFRISEEWLALPVAVLVEVTTVRAIHRVPHRAGLLAGLVNVRGELHLCVRLAQLLGIESSAEKVEEKSRRLLVVRDDGERWVFPVDEVDQVHRLPAHELSRLPATVGRAARHLTHGVFAWRGRKVGSLDVERLFQALRTRAL
jgi:chemotaxis-related protein WspD